MPLALFAVLLLVFSKGLLGQTPCAVKSGINVTTDRPYYAPTETVKIRGGGFDKSCKVTLSVIRPDSTSKGDQASSTDANGGFSNTYAVPALKGTYTIQALGSGRALLASTTFRVLDWTVSTDSADYHPGDTVTITGSGWRVGETVKLLVHEVNRQVADRTFSATVDANGSFVNTALVMNPNDDGRSFLLTATGQASGLTAQTTFTDGIKTWLGGVSTDWGTGGNWFPSGTPSSGDSVLIPGGLTNYPVVSGTFSITIITVNSFGTGATLTVASGGALTNLGALTINANGTAIVTGGTFTQGAAITDNGDLNVSGGTFDATGFDIAAGTGNLTVSGSGAFLAKNVLNTGSVTISTSSTVTLNDLGAGPAATMSSGTLKIARNFRPVSFSSTGGTVEFTGTATALAFPSSYQFFNILIDAAAVPGFDKTANTTTVKGNWTNNSASTSLTALVTIVAFAGSSAQTIGGSVATTFRDLTINNSSGVSLSGIDATVGTPTLAGLLTFTSGNITTGANTLIMAHAATVARTSGHVVGNFRKQVSANGTFTGTHEVGTGTNYTPVVGTINSAASTSTTGTTFLTVSTTASDHPNIATYYFRCSIPGKAGSTLAIRIPKSITRRSLET